MKKLRLTAALLMFVLCLCATSFALADDAGGTDWYWLSSDEKYSNFFDPASVVATASVETARGRVPTEIEAYIKTGYSYGGAQETIAAYGIGEVIPDPAQLSFSVALLKVNPQNRTVQYMKEDFYDASGRVLWSHTDGREKEINSQSFDEQYYDAIVDHVFHQHELERRVAQDRWQDLWTSEVDGLTTTAIADTTTMRRKGDNLIYWEWDTVKNVAGDTLEIKFLKKAVNLPQGTERIVAARYWSGQTGWKDMEDDMGGAYRLIKSGMPQADGLTVLRLYAKDHAAWVDRYRIDA
ncbi:hypothetical protein [Selenomonas bovis]|jgi:hypothetical protein|uniref:hypothetical protein n=1 Tax=Selenomonas TaxID=970 RepID=UPI000A5BD03D|nr:hypothetical protein [Selenomonas bovis]MCI6751836.1 hypothetical protein [Selenomonas bovis]MCI7055963.1 hypothetical protein [Selenomonas bovis]